jgi:hypothetical protein
MNVIDYSLLYKKGNDWSFKLIIYNQQFGVIEHYQNL